MQTTIEFVLTGDEKMHCVGCETRIANALRQIAGVRNVRASADSQHVLVLMDSAGTAGPRQIEEKLRQLGYEAKPVGGAAGAS